MAAILDPKLDPRAVVSEHIHRTQRGAEIHRDALKNRGYAVSMVAYDSADESWVFDLYISPEGN